jgi:stress-induced morphogen
MAMAANDIERLIKAGIPDAEVTIRDLAGDGEGKLHALALQTGLPAR